MTCQCVNAKKSIQKQSGRKISLFLAVLLPLFFSSTASPDDRIKLVGAIVEGSDDGSVPDWNGGLPVKPKNDNGHHDNPYAGETPLFVIDAKNYEAHRERLTPGLIALLETYPKSFRIPVYPSHRSVRYPDWLYENMTRKIDPKPSLSESGTVLENAIAGVNFPHPRSGLEVIWNHLTRWRGKYMERDFTEAIVYESGETQLTKGKQEIAYELFRDVNARPEERQVLLYYTSYVTAPAKLAGGALLAIDFLNQKLNPRKAWSYDAGQRRVKRLPYITYDSPAIMAESLRTADDTDMFNGAPDRFQWNLLGRRIMYVPYNSYSLSSSEVSYDALLTPHHVNPEYVRFEAHRVWEVEGILKPSAYHIYSKRRFYIDEDSWSILVGDQYDHEGKIWRVSLAFTKQFYEVPVLFTAADVFHDLKTGDYHAGGLTNEERSSGEFHEKMPDPAYFSPAGLRAKVKR